MKRRFFSFLSLLLVMVSAVPARAITAEWLVKPEYDAIRPLGEGLYLLMDRGKCGVIDSEGEWVVSMGADSITSFTDGIALIMTRTSDGMRIDKLLRANRSLIPLPGDLYASDFPFFSEGLLPVYKKGKGGYIDENGFEVIPFKFADLHPFSEGLALVSKRKNVGRSILGGVAKGFAAVGMGHDSKEKLYYIDRTGKEIKLHKNVGDIYFGTTFSNGEALVRNKEDRYIMIDRNGNALRAEGNNNIELDYKGALAGRGSSASKSAITPDNIEVYSNGSLYGYRQNTSVILPPQFTNAQPFYQGLAIVDRFRKWGIIRIVDGIVKVEFTKSDTKSEKNGYERFDVRIQLPANYNASTVRMHLRDDNTTIEEGVGQNTDGVYTLSILVPTDREKMKSAELIVDNLILWKEETDKIPQFAGKAKNGQLAFAHSTVPLKANPKDDQATLVVSIRNNSSHPVKAPLSVKGAYTKTKKVDLAAGKAMNITLSFAKVYEEGMRYFTITVGDIVYKSRIQVVPFFDF